MLFNVLGKTLSASCGQKDDIHVDAQGYGSLDISPLYADILSRCAQQYKISDKESMGGGV
jgi:hypothetical protein